jgi:hypothetical protein
MNPFVRIIYIAHARGKLDGWSVLNIKKYPNENHFPSEYKYVLFTKTHTFLKNKEIEGSIQEVINKL